MPREVRAPFIQAGPVGKLREAGFRGVQLVQDRLAAELARRLGVSVRRGGVAAVRCVGPGRECPPVARDGCARLQAAGTNVQARAGRGNVGLGTYPLIAGPDSRAGQ